MRQLPLPFAIDAGFAAADFVEGPGSEAARRWLGRTACWPQGRLALYGEAGVGKSHLLHIWAKRSAACIVTGPALQGAVAREAPAIAVDDADCVGDESALLHLLNLAGEGGTPVLLAGRTAPHDWPIRLPDLASRLKAMQAVVVVAPGDAELAVIFARFLSTHQLVVRSELQAWLLARLPRRPAVLAEAAARLDRMALAAGRRVGRRMAIDVLTELGAGTEEENAQPKEASSADPVLL